MTARPELSHEDLGHVPITARGCRFWITRHALKRSQQMRIRPELIAHIIDHGERVPAPRGSRYVGSCIYRLGDVAVATARHAPTTIATVLWSTADAWRRNVADEHSDRAYRGDEATRLALSKWTNPNTGRKHR